MEEKHISQGLLCFGGSFNPIHNAHLRCVGEVADRLGFPRAMLIPSAQPPHKPEQADLASATDRLTMCRIAVSPDRRIEVSDIELHRSGPSYTFDTVCLLKQQGNAAISWLIGADMLMILPKWHRSRELIREARILVMARPGVPIDWAALPAEFQTLRDNIVSAPLIDISATEIRRRIKAGESIDHLVPAGVAAYITERGLYR